MDQVGILPNFQGVTIHDGWKAYFQYMECQHGLCNVHHLRELTFFAEEEKAVWAQYLKELLLGAKEAVKEARQAGQHSLDPQVLQKIETDYQEILGGASLMQPTLRGKGGRRKKTEQQNLIDRLLKHQESVLAFMYDFRVPFDNNLAERDLRMMKVKEKVSGTFRSLQGAQSFARIRGYLSTIRKNEGNIVNGVRNAFAGQPFQIPQPKAAISC